MMSKDNVVDRKTVQQINTWYNFVLQGETEFHGQFSQTSIEMQPAHLNGMPVDLAVANIISIRRVNNPGWLVSRKFMYFLFELTDGTKLAGVPNNNVCTVNMALIENCKVEFENILQVKKVGK